MSGTPKFAVTRCVVRVQHRISGQQGVLVSRGIWYAAVKFDGEDGTSWVANDSIREI